VKHACLTFLFCFFLRNGFFTEEKTNDCSFSKMLQKSSFLLSPVVLFKKHDNNNKNSLRRRQKKKKNGPAGDDGTFRARIQRGFVF